MENRFTVKDFFLVVLMLCVILSVVLAMYQYDRQWTTLQDMKNQIMSLSSSQADQGKTLADISKQLEHGVVAAPTTSASNVAAIASTQSVGGTVNLKDPFIFVKEAQKNPDYARGDWLVQNFGAKVSILTPLRSTDTYASIVQNRITESLAYRDPESLDWIPLLATDWKISPDGMKIDVTLRRGVTFSDGTPFTADDLVFTFDFIMDPTVDAPRARAGYEPLEKIVKLDDFTVQFVFKRPYFDALSVALGTQPMSKKFYTSVSIEDFNKSVGMLIGTGPYRLKDPSSWRPGLPIELFRNERYWGAPGPFDRLYWNEVEENAAALTMFRNGETDTFGAQPEQYESLKNDKDIIAKSNRYEYYFRDGGYTYVAWNESREGKATIFKDKRVRQALTMLIDRNKIAKDVYLGYAKPAVGPFGVVSPQNDPTVQPWPYDVKRALALLADAGFSKKNDQGILINDANQEFRFKLIYGNKNPNTEKIVLQMKDSFARAGIVLEQEPTDWPVMLKKLDNRDFDAITLGWTGGIEGDIYQMFHSSQTKEGDNFMSYANPELDNVIMAARQEVDPVKRMVIWNKAHRIIHEDQPYTFLVINQALQFVDKRIKNVKETKSGLNFFGQDVMPIPWYVPASERKHTE